MMYSTRNRWPAVQWLRFVRFQCNVTGGKNVMKNSILVFLVSTLMSTSVFAGSGLDDGDDHSQASQHDHASIPGANHHGVSGGPVGMPAEATTASQTVKVSLTDEMRIKFDKELTPIKSGTIIQFVVTNEGKIPHEFAIGNQTEQQAHAEMMLKMPGMTHSDGNTLTVEPGMTKELTWNFEGDDVVVFACNFPGHYEAGMFQKAVLSP
jgi:uncharacterized cupredoxin-like copper-binding protein